MISSSTLPQEKEAVIEMAIHWIPAGLISLVVARGGLWTNKFDEIANSSPLLSFKLLTQDFEAEPVVLGAGERFA